MATSRRPVSSKRASKAAPRPEVAVQVLRKLRLLFNTVRSHFRDVERKAGVAGAQVWALSVVRGEPGIGVGALARAMDVHQSTASNLIRPLIEKGLLAAVRSPNDGRAIHLRITRGGTAVLRKAPQPVIGVLPEVLSRLDVNSLQRLDEDLAALIALLDVDKRSARVPLGRPES